MWTSKKLKDYESEIRGQAVPFLDRGIVHAIRQLHQFVPDKKILLDVYENNFDAEACRKGANFVPFQEKELAALRALDAGKGLPEWVPPKPIHPNFWELLEAPMEEGEPSGVTVVTSKASAEPNSSSILPPGSSSEPPSRA